MRLEVPFLFVFVVRQLCTEFVRLGNKVPGNWSKNTARLTLLNPPQYSSSCYPPNNPECCSRNAFTLVLNARRLCIVRKPRARVSCYCCICLCLKVSFHWRRPAIDSLAVFVVAGSVGRGTSGFLNPHTPTPAGGRAEVKDLLLSLRHRDRGAEIAQLGER